MSLHESEMLIRTRNQTVSVTVSLKVHSGDTCIFLDTRQVLIILVNGCKERQGRFLLQHQVSLLVALLEQEYLTIQLLDRLGTFWHLTVIYPGM